MSLEDRLAGLQKQFDNFRIIGGAGVNVHGEMRRGYALEFDVDATGGEADLTPMKDRGACCFDDGSCFDNVTEEDCLGAYQGDGTECSTFTCPIPGCTDPGANNYDADATIDDGSCEYSFGACCFNDLCYIDTEFNCDTYGVYQGDDTECEPNPCPDPMGACCEPGGFCSESTEDDCAGDYQGDDTICAGVECPTGCPTITMLCDSISAAASKCGYSHDGKVYLSKAVEQLFTVVSDIGGGQYCDGDIEARIDFYGSGSVVFTTTTSFDPLTCIEGDPSCLSDGGTITIDRDQTGDNSEKCDDVYTPCQDHSFNPACGQITPFGISSYAYASDPCGSISFPAPSVFTNYDIEYTTDMLISNVEGALPPYSGVYTDGACASGRSLSSDENTYSIQRSKPQFSYSSVAFDFYICYNEHFTPAGGGGGYDVPQCVLASTGSTEVVGPELFEPPENGTTVIRDIICIPA